MNRTIDGEVLVQHLSQDELTIDRELLAARGRSARTLIKEGPMRLVLMALSPGGDLPAHSTDEPVTIHVTDGQVVFRALGNEYWLSKGDVLMFAANVEHSATSDTGCVFLLTVVRTSTSGGSHADPPA
ncbi:MAG: cupin domain-containing protein [Gemmatimonadota bacterium]|nr:cupin domain-containing protein [Gemmatimonadota bacterium]